MGHPSLSARKSLFDAEDGGAMGGNLDVEGCGHGNLFAEKEVIDGVKLVRKLEGCPGNIPSA